MRILTQKIPTLEGKEVELMGWVANRRDHGGIVFIDLRDRSGIAQLVFTPEKKELHKIADLLRSEWVIKVVGDVKKRPAGMENPELQTGNYEISVSELVVLTKAETLPFQIDNDGVDIGEEIRMTYRYLDLRRSRMTKNLKMRNKVIQFMREFLLKHDFVEVETPILGKSTPEGARDYLVPSRVHAGKFYALPQSPQQYKQLLMVAGLERYFQIARCFRDEDTRGDRQPEFTQLDVEMSFISQDDILGLMEELYLLIVRELYPDKELTLDKNGRIPRMIYADVMEKYGTDCPDIRKDKNNPDEFAFLFIVDFPAFEWKETDKRWGSMHHPFTMPQVEGVKEFKEKFEKDPSSILAYQYDLVLNGYEIGGGSIRIHDPELLAAVFEALGNKPEEVQNKFGHLLRAFEYGVPPHGGIASGIDRFIMILQNEPNIREIIAFPKTGDGRDLMMGAPDEVSEEQLRELHIKVEKDD